MHGVAPRGPEDGSPITKAVSPTPNSTRRTCPRNKTADENRDVESDAHIAPPTEWISVAVCSNTGRSQTTNEFNRRWACFTTRNVIAQRLFRNPRLALISSLHNGNALRLGSNIRLTELAHVDANDSVNYLSQLGSLARLAGHTYFHHAIA